MIFTKLKSYEDIIEHLDATDVITFISCSSCARKSGSSGEDRMKALAMKLREDGYEVAGGYSINAVCTPKVIQAKMDKKVNTLIIMACTAGSSNMKHHFGNYKILEAVDDIGLMAANLKQHTVKVEVPYEKVINEKGKVYQMFTGKAIENENTLIKEGE